MRIKTHCQKKSSLLLPGGIISRLPLLLLCAFAVMIFARPRVVFAAEVEILTPVPKAVVLARQAETHLVLRQALKGATSQVQVKQSGDILEPLVDMEGEDYRYLHFRLPLKPGLNNFTVIPGGKQLELTYKPLQALLPLDLKDFSLFHLDDKLPESCVECHELLESRTTEPVGLTEWTSCGVCHKNKIENNPWQHSTTVNLQCLSCHQRYVKPWRIGFREGKIDETCYACHTGEKIWETSKHRHGPLIGGCTLCHNPHGDKNKYLLWAEGTYQICVTCHDDKQKLLDKDKPIPYVHGIIAGKGCTACHDPHATDNIYMLLKPINELCVSCHQKLAGVTRGHPVARHPVGGPPEKRRPDRKLSCVSCHDPHGSRYSNLLIGEVLGGSLCRVCHNKE